MLDVLMTNLSQLETLAPAQLAALVAALKAVNDPASEEWRQGLVSAIEDGKLEDAGLFGMNIVSGDVTLEPCP